MGPNVEPPLVTLSQGSHRCQFLLPTTLRGNTHPSCQPRDLAWALVLQVLSGLGHIWPAWLTFSLHSLPEAVLKGCGPKLSEEHIGRTFQRMSDPSQEPRAKAQTLSGKVNSSPHTQSWQTSFYYFFCLLLGV